MKFSDTRNFPTLSKVSEKLFEVTSLYFKYTRHKSHKSLLISLIQYLYRPTIFSYSTFGQENINQFQYVICLAHPIICLAHPSWCKDITSWAKLRRMEWMESYFFFPAKLFVYLSTLSPAHLFVIRRKLQRWEGGIRGDFKNTHFSTL